MKKLVTIVVVIILVATMSVMLAACNNDSFSKLNREFKSVVATAESMDSVSDEDLNSVQMYSIMSQDVILLSSDIAEQGTTIPTKVSEVIAIHDEIKAKTLSIQAKRTELRAEAQKIKVLIQEYRSLNAELSAEEKILVDEYIEELKGINSTLRGTIGQAYKRMHDLRGHYNLGNIDTIHTTFSEVNEVLALREDNIDRLMEIAADVKELLELKLA